MAKPTAMLFAPPLPPVQLDERDEVVIGRQADCEIPLRSRESSRRHAAVRYRDGDYTLRDLGSTNGTFLNDEPVEGEVAIQPGDRILVGGVAITFCQVDDLIAGMLPASGAEAQTILAEAPAVGGSDSVHGDLVAVPAFALVQMLELGSRSGVLSLRGECTGRIWVEEGRPIHAETEKQTGFEAGIEMIRAETGRFEFGPGEDAEERSIEASMTELLLEASCRIDENRE